MADAMQASCAAPVFKRPRLEHSPCKGDTLLAFESVQPADSFSQDSELVEDSNGELSTVAGHYCQNSVSSITNVGNAVAEEKPKNTQGNHSHGCALTEVNTSDMYSSKIQNSSACRIEKESEENEVEDQESTISELSGLSDLSNFSGQDWKTAPGPISWVQRQMINGMDPRMILMELVPKDAVIPNWNDAVLWRIIINLLSEPRRTKLAHINTLDDAVNLLRTCRKVVVLTGAGVSVSCGIPDFRSRNGIYARLSKDYPDLPDPQAMFDILYFRRDPRPFFKFAKEIYPGQFKPSPSHHFIKLLEEQEKLLRNYTQNIDTLEHAAGIKNVITCHGSFATATCTVCGYKVDSSVIKDDIFSQRIPYCPICPSDMEERGIMKPDIVFFGEGLSDEFHEALASDKDECDLLIVIGSSLKVRPVAMIPVSVPANVPQILINREPLKHLTFDIELLGDCDVIIGELCRRLEMDWDIEETIPRSTLKEISSLPSIKHGLKSRTDNINSSQPSPELNNNSDSPESDTTRNSSSDSPEWHLPPSEESNSCDCRGLSAIKLEDSEDGSNQGQQQNGTGKEESPSRGEQSQYGGKQDWPPPRAKESLSKRLPELNYLFVSPSRYIFKGAEVYKDRESDGSSSSSTEYSSDCEESPCLTSDDDDDNAECESANKEGDSSPNNLGDKLSLAEQQVTKCEQKLSTGNKDTVQSYDT